MARRVIYFVPLMEDRNVTRRFIYRVHLMEDML